MHIAHCTITFRNLPHLKGHFYENNTKQHLPLHNMLQNDAKQVEILGRFSVSPRFQESDDDLDTLKIDPELDSKAGQRQALYVMMNF